MCSASIKLIYCFLVVFEINYHAQTHLTKKKKSNQYHEVIFYLIDRREMETKFICLLCKKKAPSFLESNQFSYLLIVFNIPLVCKCLKITLWSFWFKKNCKLWYT